MLVTRADRGTLAIPDPQTGTLLDLIDVGHLPDGIGLGASGKNAYVTAAGSDHVTVIDLEQRRVMRTIAAPGGPSTAIWNPAIP